MARPSKYKPEFCERLIDYMSEGLSFDSFGAEVNASRPTLYAWTNEYPEFAQAKQMGEVMCQQWWEKAGIKGMLSGKEFNAVTWIFNMKNRFKWQDRHEIQHELGENAQKLMISVQEAKQLVSADPIDVNVIDVSSEE